MIRRATEDDADYLAGESECILRDMPEFSACPFELEHTRKMFRTYLGLSIIGCFFSQDDKGCTGFIMGIINTPFYTPQKELSEMFFWVRPDKRNSRLALNLIKVWEEWGNSEGAVKKYLGVTTGNNTLGVEKLYNKMGYRTVGLTTCKEG